MSEALARPVPEPEAPPPETALQCLMLVARHHAVRTSPAALRQALPADGREPTAAELVRAAAGVGFKATVRRLDWDDLAALPAVFPLLARLNNGNTVILVGIDRAAGMAGVVDPLADRPGVIDVPRDTFAGRWSGEIIFLKPRHGLADPNQPFGLRWFLPEILRQGHAFRDVVVAALVLHALALLVPVYFQIVIDKVLVHEALTTLQVLTIGVLTALLFEAVFRFLRQFILLSAANKIDIRLLNRTFGHLLDLPITFFDATSAGVTVRHMQQVERIREFLTGNLFSTALDSLVLLVFLPFLFSYSVKLTLITLLFAALIAGVVVGLVPVYRARLRELYNADAERQAMLVETIHGMQTVKSSALEPQQRRLWDRRAARAVTTHYRVGRISITARAITEFLEKAMMVAVVAVGAFDVFDRELTVGALIAFQMLSGRVVTPLVQIVSLIHQYQETALSVRMLGEVMNHPAEPRREGTGACPRLTGRIEISDVGFRYSRNRPPALEGLSLSVAAGSVVGVVGRSGSGKSTLMRLLQGFYPLQDGHIRYDGVDIRELDLGYLRRSIGVVLQENFLFRGSIRDNIAVTRMEASPEEIIEAARLAGAHDFIQDLPEGYDTLIEEGASNLSGGQKQRIAIARALLPQPRILILDEATSALDPDSEAVVMTNLRRIARGRTVLMVTHRLSTLTGCDTIALLEKGRLSDLAPHGVLLERCAEYRHLWQQQNRQR
ncbi:peptidase domain-containing ABC transporter [Azospirillum sp.]|uniref:peptidase domain-containing ABC transporter n=1 Tax=Azospirillum sp. TaxID=34012 RepID=UPI003D73A9FF